MRYLAILSGCVLVTLGVFALIGSADPKHDPPATEAGAHSLRQFVPVDTSRLMGSPDPLPPLEIQKAFPRLRFNRPLQATHAGDGTNRLFVVTQEGIIYVFPNRPDVTEAECKVFLDLSRFVKIVTNEEGLMSIAFHPQYRKNGRFFVYYTVRPLASVIDGYQVSRGDANRADPASRVEILRFAQPYGNHNGGSMQFGPDGYLYIGLGDGGAANDPHGNGQDLTTLLGSVLRIDVDREDPGLKYAIPKDNPFVDRGKKVRKEIWAYGVRNIWRLGFDRLTGALWAGDVGQDRWEEINILVRGGNYGWNYREGSHPFSRQKPPPGVTLIEPVIDYSHDVGRSVTGGVVYRGKRLPELFGAYLYADFVTGRIWALRYDGQKVTENKELVVSQQLPVSSFGEDEAGEVYFTAFDGFLYQFRRARRTARQAPPFPRKLSETGLFASVKDLTPVNGMIPYTVNVPLWSDGAPKSRYLALPKNRSVKFSPSGKWEFPVGTVFVKTFLLDQAQDERTGPRRLETRLFVHNPRGWAGYTYLWNDEQTDAQLLDNAVTRSYTIKTADGTGTKAWYFPSRADCNACHTQAAGHVLGPNTRQLNRRHVYGDASENQLAVLDRLGVFTEPLSRPADELEAYPEWGASTDTASLARAYLDANCAMCHQPGSSSGTITDLRYHTPLEKAQLIDQVPGKIRVGPPDARMIVPGQPGKSELLLRMAARGSGQMPPLATFLPDHEAIEVISEWIKSIPADSGSGLQP
jgi:uncharacterized repeat protein (TIGR03806 family)